jgi:uncharacterized membrane protein
MPLSFGVPVGILFMLVGLVVFFITRERRYALVLAGLGAAILVVTLLTLFLAANSGM